jgi:hypothetical protein
MKSFYMIKHLGMVMLTVGTAFGANNSLVVPKKKPASVSKLKIEIGETYGELMERQASIAERLAQSNRELVHRTRELLENDCTSSMSQLKKYQEELQGFEKKLVAFEHDAQCMFNCLHKGIPA